MTAAQSDHIAGTVLIAVALVWVALFIAGRLLIAMRQRDDDRKWRDRPTSPPLLVMHTEAEWREWFLAQPSSVQKRAGDRLLAALREQQAADVRGGGR